MMEAAVIERQERLETVFQFSTSFCDMLKQSGLASDDLLRQALNSTVTAKCVQCGITITGDKFLSLRETNVPKNIARLRDGYCARNGCDSYYYYFAFQPKQGLDWTRLLHQIEAVTEITLQDQSSTVEAPVEQKRERWKSRGRWILVVAAISFLLLIRHWRSGGTIPLIRQPENFQVDRIPNNELEGESHVLN